MSRHKRTVLALGLRKIGQESILPDNPQVRGMIRQVAYMVEVKPLGKGDK
jgi:large subunit ribosomal protein L30